MSQNANIPEGKDPLLWEIAQKRAGFKSHLTTYIIVNSFLWFTWFVTSSRYTGDIMDMNFPWPIWPTLGWGIGLAYNYADAYIFPKANTVEREYQKLSAKQ
jgi:hypothetical protein